MDHHYAPNTVWLWRICRAALAGRYVYQVQSKIDCLPYFLFFLFCSAFSFSVIIILIIPFVPCFIFEKKNYERKKQNKRRFFTHKRFIFIILFYKWIRKRKKREKLYIEIGKMRKILSISPSKMQHFLLGGIVFNKGKVMKQLDR